MEGTATDRGTRLPDWENTAAEPGMTIWCFDRSGSTMDLARELDPQLEAGKIGLVVSLRQEAGRGRQGRKWIPPERGFYATYLFRTANAPEKLLGLSPAIGVTVAELIEGLGGDVQVKWPNDVLDRSGGKVAGILIETTRIGAQSTVLIGIGINLSGVPEDNLDATSIEALTGNKFSQLEIAQRLSPFLCERWRKFSDAGFEPFRGLFMERAAFLNQEVTLNHDGTAEKGIFRGVAADGSLQLEIIGQSVTRCVGEVSALRPV